MNIDPARAICGVAAVFGQPSANDNWVFQPEQFQDWLALGMGLPMRVDHGPLVDGRGVILHLGRWVDFAIIEYPIHGLLALGEVGDHASTRGYGSSLLHDLQLIFDQRWLPSDYWALSIAAHVGDAAVLPYEVSLTRAPACHDAVLLGVGPEAIRSWDFLTEKRITSDRQG